MGWLDPKINGKSVSMFQITVVWNSLAEVVVVDEIALKVLLLPLYVIDKS